MKKKLVKEMKITFHIKILIYANMRMNVKKLVKEMKITFDHVSDKGLGKEKEKGS